MWISATDVRERLFIGACVVLLFVGHALYGALAGEASLMMVGGWALLLLLGACWPRWEVERFRPSLVWPAIFLGLTLLVALLSLTGAAPGQQPIWAAIGLPGASTVDKSATVLEIVKLLGLACAFSVGFGIGERERLGLKAVKAIVYSGAAFCLLAVIVFVGGLAVQTQHNRLEAFFLNPNTAGSFCAAILCLCTGLIIRGARQFQATGRWDGLAGSVACAVISLTALLMTNSRAALVVAVLALGLIIVWQVMAGRLKARRAIGMAVIAGGAILVAALVSGRVISRMGELDADASLRGLIATAHWRAFIDAPWMGHGLGSFETVNRTRLTPDTFRALWNIRSAENVYLQWLEEAGLLGALPMFACVGAILRLTALNIAKRRSMLAPLHALMAVNLVFILHGAVDFGLQTPSVSTFWAFLLGLQLAWSEGSSSRRSQ